ncbi:hypothetical protein COOONC_20082 [Cooperia oncophora]
METIATPQKEAIVEWVQVSNTITSSICGIAIHSYILYSVTKCYTSLSQYMSLIAIQSAVGVLLNLAQLIGNERYTLSGVRLISFPFLPFGLVTKKIVFFSIAALYALEQFLIMIFNIHRVLMFLSNLICLHLRIELVGAVMQAILVPAALIISIVCYILINRYFRSNSGHTTKVKQMQARFSTSIFVEVTMTMLRWYSVAIGSLTLWSIFGYLKHKKRHGPGTSTEIKVKTFSVARQSRNRCAPNTT